MSKQRCVLTNQLKLWSFFSACLATVDLGFIIDFSNSVQDEHSEMDHFLDMQDFIVRTAAIFDISQNSTHFGYIPFSTHADDLPTQYFNNSDLPSVPAGNNTAQMEHLKKVVQPLTPNPISGLFKDYFLRFYEHFKTCFII